jgi:crotonobetainyl-CoA:carnitine CoA-transferase CaiB-like acyl-CoA transferase
MSVSHLLPGPVCTLHLADSAAILREAGHDDAAIEQLRTQGVI